MLYLGAIVFNKCEEPVAESLNKILPYMIYFDCGIEKAGKVNKVRNYHKILSFFNILNVFQSKMLLLTLSDIK